MRTLRNEVTYAVGCACDVCRKESGRDFEVISGLYSMIEEAKKELESCKNSQHESVFLVRETVEPIPQKKPKARKAA